MTTTTATKPAPPAAKKHPDPAPLHAWLVEVLEMIDLISSPGRLAERIRFMPDADPGEHVAALVAVLRALDFDPSSTWGAKAVAEKLTRFANTLRDQIAGQLVEELLPRLVAATRAGGETDSDVLLAASVPTGSIEVHGLNAGLLGFTDMICLLAYDALPPYHKLRRMISAADCWMRDPLRPRATLVLGRPVAGFLNGPEVPVYFDLQAVVALTRARRTQADVHEAELARLERERLAAIERWRLQQPITVADMEKATAALAASAAAPPQAPAPAATAQGPADAG